MSITGREPALPVESNLTGNEPGLSSNNWVPMCWHIHGITGYNGWPWPEPKKVIPDTKLELVRHIVGKLMEYPLVLRNVRFVHIYDIVTEQFLVFMDVSEQKANALWGVLHKTFRHSSFYRVRADKYDQIVQLQQQHEQLERDFQAFLAGEVYTLEDTKGKMK